MPQPSTASHDPHDLNPHVAVVGAGPTGRLAALAMAAGGGLRVTLLDARPAKTKPAGEDLRATALAPATVRMLEALDIWPALEQAAQPVARMRLTDSDLDTPARPPLLSFGDEDETAGEPLAHMVPNGALNAALHEAVEAASIALRFGARVTGWRGGTLALEGGETLEAALVVAADGAASPLRAMAGLRTLERDYGQTGIVATVAHDRPHDGETVQHFLPNGPFALLPLKGTENEPHLTSIVWSEADGEAARILALDEAGILAELTRRFGYRWGAPRLVGEPASYPLRLRLARDMAAPGLALVGDAAHVIHPLAGQGFNLAAKDVAALAELVVEARRTGRAIGTMTVLEAYQRWRRADVALMAGVTHGLNSLFSNDAALPRALRDFGLRLVERTPALKRRFAAGASGQGAGAPRLLDGLRL